MWMHQEHNIPWNILASNVAFICDRDDPKSIGTPRLTAYVPRSLPTQAKSMIHFAKSIGITISKVAKTERAKYPELLVPPPTGKIFSGELCDQFPILLNRRNQLMKHWISRARRVQDAAEPRYCYTRDDGDLSAVVCTLLHARLFHHSSCLLSTQHTAA